MTIARREGQGQTLRWPVWLCGASCLALVFTAYLTFDIWAAISLRPGAVLLACVASLPGALLLGYGRARIARLALPVLVLALIVLVPLVDWDTRKPFLRAFNTVETGMTVEQVDRIMAPYIRRPVGSGLLESGVVGYGHTKAGWGNSDSGIVYFVDGRVVRSVFSPD